MITGSIVLIGGSRAALLLKLNIHVGCKALSRRVGLMILLIYYWLNPIAHFQWHDPSLGKFNDCRNCEFRGFIICTLVTGIDVELDLLAYGMISKFLIIVIPLEKVAIGIMLCLFMFLGSAYICGGATSAHSRPRAPHCLHAGRSSTHGSETASGCSNTGLFFHLL